MRAIQVTAIQVTQTGGPEVLSLTELSDPEPGPGQLLVELAAAGVNYIDTYHRSGAYPMPLPFIPGSEGTVTAVGPGGEVRRLTGGQGVAAVYDGVGASTFDASLASLRPRGMLALYGAAIRWHSQASASG